MIIKQLSVFIENTAGRVCEVMGVLADANINVSALSIADGSDFGIMRLIVKDHEEAYKLLKDAGFTVKKTPVICCKVPDTPGGLRRILTYLAQENISIDYMYAFSIGQDASIMIRTEDPEKTIEVLSKNNLEVMCSRDLYQAD